MLYLFACELTRPLAEHPELVRYIDAHTPQARPLENAWLLEIADLPYNLQRQVQALIGKQDKFYIVDVSKSIVAWSGIEAEVAEFVQRFTEPTEQDVEERLLIVASDGPIDTRVIGEAAGSEAQPLLAHLWQVRTGRTPEQVAQALGNAAGGNRLLVADVSLAPAAWSHLPEESALAAVAYTRSEQGDRQEF